MNETGFFGSILISVITAVLAENIVFARAFGVSTMIVSARNKRNLPGICAGVMLFTVTSSIVTWAVSSFSGILAADRPYLPLIFIVIIGAVYVVSLFASFVFIRDRFPKIKKYVHIAAFNSAVMGTIFLSASNCLEFSEFVLFGITSGLGFTFAAVMLSGVYGQFYSKDVPDAFRGYPAVMIFTGIIAMAVYGVLGHAPAFV